VQAALGKQLIKRENRKQSPMPKLYSMNPVEQRKLASNREITSPQAQPEPTPLTPEVAIVKLMRLIPDYSKFGIKSLAIFGSVARDEARPDSDVDILVEFTEPLTLQTYMKLKLYLEKLLERKVDLADIDMLRPEIIDNVMEDAIPIDLVQFD